MKETREQKMERKGLSYFRDSKRFFTEKGAYFAHLPNGHIMAKVQNYFLMPSSCSQNGPTVMCTNMSSSALVSSKRMAALVFLDKTLIHGLH